VTQLSANPADLPASASQADGRTTDQADGNGQVSGPGPGDDAGGVLADIQPGAIHPASAGPHADNGHGLTPAPQTAPAEGGPQEPAGSQEPADPSGVKEPTGPIERLMSFTIRKLAWSRLADPRIAVAISGLGLFLGMVVGATAPNAETLRFVQLPLSHLVPSLLHQDALASAILYTAVVLSCVGLAGMLWAHSQGWRPDPRRLLMVSTVVVAIMVCLTPVGSSDTASYAAYGRLASLGQNPYSANSLQWLAAHDPGYVKVVGLQWKNQPSVYGPVATWIQSFAAWIGGPHVATTIWILMILNGLAFLAIGLVLLKTSRDPLRATLFWTANPVLILELVGGGHFDTFVAAAAIAAIQLARRPPRLWSDALIGVVIGLGCGVKITALLVALGLAYPLLLRREWLRVARIAVIAMATVALEYSFYGVAALKPLFAGSQWVTLPSPWWFLQAIGDALGVHKGTLSLLISCLWIVSMFVVAWFVYKRISAEQPREVVAPFALTYAWVLVAPWVFAWYTALPWVALTQVPRNRMTRWLTIVTAVLAIWHSSGGWVVPGRV
jgi:hypothetical protein